MVLETSDGAVESLITRALRGLRRELDGEEEHHEPRG